MLVKGQADWMDPNQGEECNIHAQDYRIRVPHLSVQATALMIPYQKVSETFTGEQANEQHVMSG